MDNKNLQQASSPPGSLPVEDAQVRRAFRPATGIGNLYNFIFKKIENKDNFNYTYNSSQINSTNINIIQLPLDLIDNPVLNSYNMSYSINSDSKTWNGCDIILENKDKEIFLANHDSESITGIVIDINKIGGISPAILDRTTKITILLNDENEIMSNSNDNYCIIGREILFFKTAKYISDKRLGKIFIFYPYWRG